MLTIAKIPSVRTLVEPEFDADWYYSTYVDILEEEGVGPEGALDHYLRGGARRGHDPHAGFCELHYRLTHLDVCEHLVDNVDEFGFLHFLRYGRNEKERVRPTAEQTEEFRSIFLALDQDFIRDHYEVDLEKNISAADFYFQEVKEKRVSPNPRFSEEAYRAENPDVDEVVRSGILPSGYQHYRKTIELEERAAISVAEFTRKKRARLLASRRDILERNLPGITHPSGLETLRSVSFLRTGGHVRTRRAGPDVLCLVPNFCPEILFGGYQGFFNVMDEVRRQAKAALHLLVVSRIDESLHRWNCARMAATNGRISRIFERIDLLREDGPVHVGQSTVVVSYSAETHYLAGRLSAETGRTPIFFIQDFEPDFHPSGDLRSFTRSAFRLPHKAIYNTDVLRAAFAAEGLSAEQVSDAGSVAIDNFVRPLPMSKGEFVAMHSKKDARRLIFYGRPEAHAGRNHFATFVLALEAAIEQGVFAGNWEFVSVGSLAFEGHHPLPRGNRLEIVARLPKEAYEQLLITGDIGASFISTPHPGIIHFQMAQFGLTTLTNVAPGRGREWLAGYSPNLIGCELQEDALVEALRLAVERSGAVTERYRNARAAPHRSRADCVRPAVDMLLAEMGR